MSDLEQVTIRVHDEGTEGLWAEVVELPGCFASGATRAELHEALEDALSLYLSTPERQARVRLTDIPKAESVELTEQRVMVS
jgi:predicted RNase H-like HicB family nuclease